MLGHMTTAMTGLLGLMGSMPLLANVSPLRFMALPFAECLILVGIHSYLGIHVIRRKVIFVDLSLAQIAALGTTVGFLFGIHPHSVGAFLFSLSFTFLGAAIFAVTRTDERRVPQEAIIGIVYALAAALVILVIDRAPHGAEHIKETLTGAILWVKPKEVWHAAVAYSLVGVIHYVFRDKFLAITHNHEKAAKSGINVRLWDLVFYMTFGFVITFSVGTAGVLLVFVFLVVPAVIAVSITDNLKYQLIIGWTMGTVVSMLGLAISYWLDLPSGPAVVAFYGLVLLIMALFLYVQRSNDPLQAIGHILVGVLVLGLVIGYFSGLTRLVNHFPSWKHGEFSAPHRHHAHGPHHHHQTALQRFDSMDIEAKTKALAHMQDTKTLETWYGQATTHEGKLKVAERMAVLRPKRGAAMLLEVIESKAPPFFKITAADKLSEICHAKFGYDPLGDATKAAAMVARMKSCVSKLGAVPDSRPNADVRPAARDVVPRTGSPESGPTDNSPADSRPDGKAATTPR